MDQHQSKNLDIEALIYINVPHEELVERLLARGRHDDNEKAIMKRFEEYARSTAPIIENYRKKGIKIIEVEGRGEIDDIHRKILTSLRA